MGKLLQFPGAARTAAAVVRLAPEWLSLSAEPGAVCLLVHGPEQAVEIWLSPEQARGMAEDLVERADDAAPGGI